MSTVAVDPRIRARRVAVRRNAGRRRLRRFAALGMVAALAGLAFSITWTPVLDVDRVEVDGVYRTPVEAVRAAAGIDQGDALLWLDTGAAEDRIARLPWVAEVSVERRWPGTITVDLRERVPAAAVPTADGTWLVADGEGRVVATADVQPDSFLLLEGVTGAGEPGDTLPAETHDALSVAAAVPEVLRPEVAAVLGPPGALQLRLTSGGLVELGDRERIEDKLLAAAAVLGSVSAECVERLDVTLPSSPAMVPVPGCT
jgi:cell division protein FtsQ